jgi:hypothetical protein
VSVFPVATGSGLSPTLTASVGAEETVVFCAAVAKSPAASVRSTELVRIVPLGRMPAIRAVMAITPLVPTFSAPIVHRFVVPGSGAGMLLTKTTFGS